MAPDDTIVIDVWNAEQNCSENKAVDTTFGVMYTYPHVYSCGYMFGIYLSIMAGTAFLVLMDSRLPICMYMVGNVLQQFHLVS